MLSTSTFKPPLIEVEAEAADLQRFAAALMLAGVEAAVQEVENLIIAGEEGFRKGFGAVVVDAGLDGFRGDDDGSEDLGEFGLLLSRLLSGGGERGGENKEQSGHAAKFPK
jgi:hypothetical protein